MNIQKSSRIVAKAELVMDSVLHIGGGDFLNYTGIIAQYRDGMGRPVIPGSSVAGVFVQRAIEILSSTDDAELANLWPKITGKGRTEESTDASIYIFPTLKLCHGDSLSVDPVFNRDMVALDPRTKTAMDKAKFAFEVLEPGLRFEFVTIVDCHRFTEESDRIKAIQLLNRILGMEWSDKGRGFIGGGSARGMGWFHLENLCFAAVDSAVAMRTYLEARDESVWMKQCEREGTTVVSNQVNEELGGEWKAEPLTDWKIRIVPREEKNGFGIWPTIVRTGKEQTLDKKSDMEFTTTRFWTYKDGRWSYRIVPTIPGSSLRGAARALLTRLAKSKTSHGNFRPGYNRRSLGNGKKSWLVWLVLSWLQGPRNRKVYGMRHAWNRNKRERLGNNI